MHCITLDRVTLSYAAREIFAELSWAIDDRARSGLIGPNGAGKSSLLRIISGDLQADSGGVQRHPGTRVGYLPQQVTLPAGRSLLETAMELPPALAEVEGRLAQVEARLAEPAVYNHERRLTQVLAQQERALADYERLGGAQHQSRVRSLLAHLGLDEADYDLPCEALSGGQKKLVALTRLAVARPDVLLLDEPDNHLDMVARRRLEAFIRNYEGAVIIVSHDRWLLDEVVTEIVELEAGVLKVWAGNYSWYATQRELARLRQQQQYTAQQKRIRQIEEAIKRFEHWARITEDPRHKRKARHRRRMLERMEAKGEMIEKVVERRQLQAEFSGWRGSTKALEITGLAMGYGDELLFVDLDLLLRHGERVGLIGPNGAGKSVLFRLVLGEETPLEGQIRIGPGTQPGYYAQDHETLGPWLERSPLERVRDIRPMSENDAVAFLLKYQFHYEQLRLPVAALSGGERSRLQLATLVLERPNLLLLDEPTNNLDIPTAEVLETALADFDGAILAISHDRYFLERTVDRIVELRDGELTSHVGGYSDWLERFG
ncbi:MAG: ABC-F family ATP-binding cassette domain-containing protein [Anaerolineaceae bacterium]|nr:ABC-F family ATP-binding cassette domain-containing protein [Anaerolineaceae bacterium]MDE0327847.1 ABC-F family ATP-binding cassette domain-containing protein [Anaerolineaceae bacterium]